MRRYTYRTKIEAAMLTLFLMVASLYIDLGQAGESSEKGHQTTQCTLCHTPYADITADGQPNMDLSRQCITCHEPQKIDEQTKLTFHQTVKRCTTCHSFHDPSRITTGERAFRYRFDRHSAQRTLCFSCHGEGESFLRISPGHQKAAELYHSDYQGLASASPSQACMLCHSETTRLESEFTTGLAIPQFAEHKDHPLGIQVIPGHGEAGNRIRTTIDSRLRLFDGKIECQTCHSLSADTRSRLIAVSSFTELCNGCHQLD